MKRKEQENKLLNNILGSWSEGIMPDTEKIKREIKRMSAKRLKEQLELFE